MSLLATASPWTNNDPPKKRVPTMGNPLAKHRTMDNVSAFDEAPSSNQIPLTPEDVQAETTERQNNVHKLIEKITTIGAENDGSHLAEFNPLPLPELNQHKSFPKLDDLLPGPKDVASKGPQYSYENRTLGSASNYNTSYESPIVYQQQHQDAKPYYAKMGLGNDNLMEKINYMIHLMEEQQHERTNNITEEFLLYTFLGVFVIYVVDSFSRSGGKYTR
jgi:hypothetical protein